MQALVRIFSALLVLSLLSALPAAAQVERAFDFEINPQFPDTGEVVTVFAETYSFDVSRAYTTWRVDGEIVKEGRGIKSIEVIAGDIGERKTVAFTATRGGETISHSTTISTSAIDLIIEPNTYTPPLYKGRALPTHEAPIRVVATPFFGNGYDAEDFIYTWRVNGTVQGSLSGAGRNILKTTAAPFSRRLEVRVDVESADGKVQGREVVSLKTETPQVLLYALNPLLGLSTASILANESELAEEEVTINAEPFYVPGTYRSSLPITYKWKLNGKTVESTNDDLGTITLRQAGNGRGKAQVSVSIEHPREVVIQGSDSAAFTFGIENSGLFNF
tara:strand:+ start:13734 stop:14732 length:999 start_codon:yes stop_codon:yes gene_type:complete